MNKLLCNIGMCKKAGKLLLGFDSVRKGVIDNTVLLIVLASDISKKTKKEVIFLSEKHKVKVAQQIFTMDQVSMILNRRVGVLGVTDQGFVTLLTSHGN